MSNELNLARLREPFAAEDIEWRLQQAGEKNGRIWAKALAYVTARAVMNRLDEVLGVDGWQITYEPGPAGGVMAKLSIRVPRPDGSYEWIVKSDGADTTDVEAVKGGYSSALKRVAVTVGIGRYLYDLEEGWARVHDGGKHFGKTKDGTAFRWDPPDLPDWALPGAPVASADQLARVEELLGRVKDAKVVANVRRRITDGLTRSAADDAIRFLEGKVAVRAA